MTLTDAQLDAYLKPPHHPANLDIVAADYRRLRAALYLVYTSLYVSDLKQDDAPCSAAAHEDEAIRVCKMVLGIEGPPADSLSQVDPNARQVRREAWTLNTAWENEARTAKQEAARLKSILTRLLEKHLIEGYIWLLPEDEVAIQEALA